MALPDLAVPAVKAKIDTGAKTSSLHAFEIEAFEENDRNFVRFHIQIGQGKVNRTIQAQAPLVGYRSVRSSNGQESLRPVISTPIQLMEQIWTIELTLADRELMGFRMLLGREALRKRFLVDSGRSFMAGKR